MLNLKGKCLNHQLALISLIFAGINWGLIGVFNWNVVNIVLGGFPLIERLAYIGLGLAGAGMLYENKCKRCGHTEGGQ